MTILRATEIFNDSRLMLIAIESVNCNHSTTSTSYRLYGKIEPIAVIVCGPDGIYALNMEAKFTILDQLRQDIPELDAIIASFNNT